MNLNNLFNKPKLKMHIIFNKKEFKIKFLLRKKMKYKILIMNSKTYGIKKKVINNHLKMILKNNK